MMTEVNVGDIVRYESHSIVRESNVYAVVLVTERIEDFIYNVIVLETNMYEAHSPWSFDPDVLNKCTLLA